MTDRIHSITLILARDMRIDDAEVLLAAARQLKGVVDAMPNICDTGSAVAETRARQELGQKIIDIIYPKRP